MVTLAAFCNLSPDSPTQMFSTSLDTRISRMELLAFLSLCNTQSHSQIGWPYYSLMLDQAPSEQRKRGR